MCLLNACELRYRDSHRDAVSQMLLVCCSRMRSEAEFSTRSLPLVYEMCACPRYGSKAGARALKHSDHWAHYLFSRPVRTLCLMPKTMMIHKVLGTSKRCTKAIDPDSCSNWSIFAEESWIGWPSLLYQVGSVFALMFTFCSCNACCLQCSQNSLLDETGKLTLLRGATLNDLAREGLEAKCVRFRMLCSLIDSAEPIYRRSLARLNFNSP